jgi:hypothetical protein
MLSNLSRFRMNFISGDGQEICEAVKMLTISLK